MMIDLFVLTFLFAAHFVGDFILQTREMALNKSTSNKWLTHHVFVYSLPFLFLFGLHFALITFALHFAVDFVSSRFNSKFWAEEDYRNFFICVGFDQFLHMVSLVWTYHLLYPNGGMWIWF